MSDGAAPRIDPRFDPRFQRGYVPDAAAVPSPEPDPQHGPERVGPTVEAAAPAALRQEGPDRSRLPLIDEAEKAEEAGPALGVFLDEPRLEDSTRIEPWFAAGWALAGIATVVGAGLWWASVSSESFYGPSNQSERWLQIVGWTVAPSLVQAGLVAAVAMLVWSGVRHAARRREERP